MYILCSSKPDNHEAIYEFIRDHSPYKPNLNPTYLSENCNLITNIETEQLENEYLIV